MTSISGSEPGRIQVMLSGAGARAFFFDTNSNFN